MPEAAVDTATPAARRAPCHSTRYHVFSTTISESRVCTIFLTVLCWRRRRTLRRRTPAARRWACWRKTNPVRLSMITPRLSPFACTSPAEGPAPEAAQDAAAPDARRARMGEPVDAIAVYKREFPDGAYWSMGERGRPIDEVLPPFHSLQPPSEEQTARQGCARASKCFGRGIGASASVPGGRAAFALEALERKLVKHAGHLQSAGGGQGGC